MTPRNLSLVKVNSRALIDADDSPFRPGMKLLFLGEIANMPGHCAVQVINTGEVVVGYHTENFSELTEEET